MDLYYTATILIAICSSAIMIISARGNAALPRRERHLFFSLFSVIIAAALCEWTSAMLNGQGGECIPIICTLKVIEFSLAPTLAVLYAAALGKSEDRRVTVAMWLCLAHAVLETALAPFGIVFYVDDTGSYHHGTWYAIYVVTYLASALFMLNETRRFSSSMQYRNRHIPWLVLGFIMAGVVAQMILGNVKITYLVLAIGGAALYTFYCSVTQQTDALTQLMNRQCFESATSSISERSAILIVDIDSFKQVNDTCGHNVGDQCLHEIGLGIFKVYSPYGYCFRTGGDEFCIIMAKGFDQIEELNRSLALILNQRRLAFPELPAVSIGYTLYDPAAGSFENAYKAADDMMYAIKEQKQVGR